MRPGGNRRCSPPPPPPAAPNPSHCGKRRRAVSGGAPPWGGALLQTLVARPTRRRRRPRRSGRRRPWWRRPKGRTARAATRRGPGDGCHGKGPRRGHREGGGWGTCSLRQMQPREAPQRTSAIAIATSRPSGAANGATTRRRMRRGGGRPRASRCVLLVSRGKTQGRRPCLAHLTVRGCNYVCTCGIRSRFAVSWTVRPQALKNLVDSGRNQRLRVFVGYKY